MHAIDICQILKSLVSLEGFSNVLCPQETCKHLVSIKRTTLVFIDQSSFNIEGDTTKMPKLPVLLFVSTLLSVASSHGFFRGYRNSRTWGTGAQRKARTFGLTRMGRQQGGDFTNSLDGG